MAWDGDMGDHDFSGATWVSKSEQPEAEQLFFKTVAPVEVFGGDESKNKK